MLAFMALNLSEQNNNVMNHLGRGESGLDTQVDEEDLGVEGLACFVAEDKEVVNEAHCFKMRLLIDWDLPFNKVGKLHFSCLACFYGVTNHVFYYWRNERNAMLGIVGGHLGR